MGARIETFYGLSGIGDLIVTCASKHSRNRKAGMLMGQGMSMDEAMKEVAMVVEGVYSAKAAKALEEESRAAANRVSRTPTKVKDTASPRWYAPTMVTLMVIGLLWVVTTYLFNGQYPLPYFTKHHATDWLLNGNLYIGFLIMMSGFLGLLRWK